MCKSNKYFSANQRNYFKESNLLRLLVEIYQRNMVYKLSMISQRLCIWCKCWRIHTMADLYL